MGRISKDRYYLQIAEGVLDRSTCLRRKYGAVIVNNDEIVSTGYNGAARGEQNCSDCGYCERERLNVPKGERYELCLDGDTVIKLLNGEYKTIRQIYNEGLQDFWIYAVDVNTGKIVPAKAAYAMVTGHSTEMVRVIFDNGKSVVCTPDHRFLMRNCEYKEAQHLEVEDSVMPMYYNFAQNNGYEAICNTISMRKGRLPEDSKCNTEQTPTHHLVYEYFNGKEWDNNVNLLHHDNEIKTDNTPDKIVLKSRSEHSRDHLTPERISKFVESGENGRNTFRERMIEDTEFAREVSARGVKNMTANWDNPDFRLKMVDIQSENGRKTMSKINKDPEMRVKMLTSRVLKGLSLLTFRMNTAGDTTVVAEHNYESVRGKYRSEGRGGDQIPKLATILKYFNTLEEALEVSKSYNHKVVKIEKIAYNNDVYDLYVPGFNNFAVDLGDNSCVFVHNCVAVHAEQNAIISAARKDMIGATIYIVGKEVATGDYANPAPCMICRRMIKNAGITRCIGLVNGEPKEISLNLN